MKKWLVVSLAAVSVGSALAASSGDSHFAIGVVQEVDRAAGTAIVAHEPVATLNWPRMTMEFTIAHPALVDRFQPGGRIAFEFIAKDNAFRILSAIPLRDVKRCFAYEPVRV